MNFKNNLIVSSSFFIGYFLYFYYMIGIREYTVYTVLGMSAISAIIVDMFNAINLGLQSKIRPSKPNEWAIVTGCTSGLGYSLARQLAEQGFNLVLIARNKDLLEKLVSDVKYTGVKTHTITHDFIGQFNGLQYALNEFIFEDKDTPQKTIGLLINNVGIALEDLTKFVNYPLQKDYDIVQVNVNSILSMTKVILPVMLVQKYGYIANIGSASSLNPSPYVSTYSATKAFLDQYTRSMAQEYQNTGVHFHASHPAFFVSGMTKVSASLFVPNNDTIANGVLKHLHCTTSSIPYFFHFVQMAFVKYHWYKTITKVVLDNLYETKQERLVKRNEKKND
jgi:17beta-estradiol 17-dehydrogenase / very-long-chain 3-oxoacyl-CoA reductase